jgi:hypothetical protein
MGKIYAIYTFLNYNLHYSQGIINVNTCMSVKLGFSPCGRNVDWGCLRREHRGKILEQQTPGL